MYWAKLPGGRQTSLDPGGRAGAPLVSLPPTFRMLPFLLLEEEEDDRRGENPNFQESGMLERRVQRRESVFEWRQGASLSAGKLYLSAAGKVVCTAVSGARETEASLLGRVRYLRVVGVQASWLRQ